MSETVISVEHLSKRYQLGVIGTGTFKDDAKIWFAKARGKPNPLTKIGEVDYGNREGDILWALKDVNFTVQKGEALGIIGHNGAGKSTLLKILARVTTPTLGHIHVKGRIASLLEVGTGFHPELTGRENVFLNGAIMGMTRAEVARKFDEIIDFSGVEKFIDTPVKRYSSGMYVRLAFAVAAHLEPEILIVDEVLAVGDAEFQKKCLGKMGDVAHEGRTVLFVSHNMPAVKALCNRAICISSGEISFSGDVNTVITNYLSDRNSLLAEKVWENRQRAPGDIFSRLHRVCITDKNKNISIDINSGESFSVEIEYWNLIDQVKLSTTLLIFNQSNEILFSSISNHEPNWHGKPRPKGLYTSICQIPADLLIPGMYTIGVIICANNYKDSYRVDDIIKFNILDVSDLRGDYFGGISGLIRPLLNWESKLIN
jgi:lipopolysaccharide transport system ATP-binding protein